MRPRDVGERGDLVLVCAIEDAALFVSSCLYDMSGEYVGAGTDTFPPCTDADRDCARPSIGVAIVDICLPDTLIVRRAVAADPADEGDECM